MICRFCGRDINAIGQDNMSRSGRPICEDCDEGDEHTPTTAEVRDYFAHGQFSDVSELEGVARFNRWLAKHDAEQAAATSLPIVHFDDDHEECARELAEVQRKLVTAKAVAASAEETTRTYREQLTEQTATIAALCGAAYNRGYREAERERQRAGDGMGLT